MKMLTPNFHFYGNCEEAMALYTRAFGAQVDVLLRYSDANPADFSMPLTDAQKKLVYHAIMHIHGYRVMMSDEMSGEKPAQAPLSLVVTLDTKDEVMAAYAVLSEGAQIVHPMEDTTYSDAFVSLIDRFGFRWEIMTER